MVKNMAGNAECQSEILCPKHGLGNALWIAWRCYFRYVNLVLVLLTAGKCFSTVQLFEMR